MSHSIQISDELWDAYGGSPSRMRDTLYLALVKSEREEPPADFETEIELQWATRCSRCGRALEQGETALYRVPVSGPKQIVCLDHSE